MIVPSDFVNNLPRMITAIGALGTAAFGLVDATKALWFGGVNRIGFSRIKTQVEALTPGTASKALSQGKVIDTLRANWYNGTTLSGQKSIAKSLIKVGLSPATAPALAAATGVDPAVLGSVANKIISGAALAPAETDVNARFDFVITALLDEVYQDADQAYTSGTRMWAAIFAILLALFGGWSINGGGSFSTFYGKPDFWLAIVAGILAVPLAPIAKDISSALATAVNTMQAIRK
jgi:hypothetical protein